MEREGQFTAEFNRIYLKTVGKRFLKDYAKLNAKGFGSLVPTERTDNAILSTELYFIHA